MQLSCPLFMNYFFTKVNLHITNLYIAHFYRDTLSEGYRDEDSYSRGDEDCFREDLSSLEMKSEPDTLRPESPDSTKGDNRSQSKCTF